MGKKAYERVSLLLGFLSGGSMLLGCWYVNRVAEVEPMRLSVGGVVLAALVIGLVLNLILHEIGHLLMGLLSGYTFVAFIVFRLAIAKEGGKLERKKFSLPGSVGSCHLSPPEMKEGTYPYKLYYSGGALVNFLFSAVCVLLFFHFAQRAPLWGMACFGVAIVGVNFGLSNLIPAKGTLLNDGYLLWSGKDQTTRRAIWSNLRIQAMHAEGCRPRDIPTELFDWVDVGNIENPLLLAVAVKKYGYLMDRGEIDEARALLQTICANMQNAPEVYQHSLGATLLFHELIAECRLDEIDRFYTKERKAYLKATSTEMSTQRILYAYARLVSEDTSRMEEHLRLFHKACRNTIYPGLIPGEQEQIAQIDKIADGY